MEKPPDPFTLSLRDHLHAHHLPLNHHGDKHLLSQSHQVKTLHHHNSKLSHPNIYDFGNLFWIISELGARSSTSLATAHLPTSLLPLRHYGTFPLISQSHQFKTIDHHNSRPDSTYLRGCESTFTARSWVGFQIYRLASEIHHHEVCKKIKVFIEKFDNQGLAQANKTTPVDAISHPSHSENWVTVASKKRVKSMINPCNFRSSNRIIKTTNTMNSTRQDQNHPPESGSVPPPITSEGPPVSTTHPSVLYRIPNPTPINPKGIILANLSAMVEDPPINEEPLDATDEGINDDEDIDKYLNFYNIEDIEISTDSSKRKRCKDGEEATSQAK
ncbi:hypothetical protein Cgig2_011066 [Carnegiea gigantea]|uniref:Uncharacterized protein n=1 Tax=Carnegiea gigantea TaxID=171969 RepID=A0A9Q1Q5Q2_9CARY|nr:hypothetical protein Cgig2_011066 [Carnegiea gigantea]